MSRLIPDSTHLGQGQLNPVDLSLVSETVFTSELDAQHSSQFLSHPAFLLLPAQGLP